MSSVPHKTLLTSPARLRLLGATQPPASSFEPRPLTLPPDATTRLALFPARRILVMQCSTYNFQPALPARHPFLGCPADAKP